MDLFEKGRVFKALVAADLILLALHLASQIFIVNISWTISEWFNFDSEINIPTWFSSSKLLILFFLSLTYATLIRDKYHSRLYLAMSAVFLFFSADEAASIHESLTLLFQKASVYSPLPNAHGIWIFIYPAAVLALAVTFRKGVVLFFQEEVGRAIFILGGVVFVGGGIGFEVIGYFIETEQSRESTAYLMEVSLEESFELLGQSLMILGLMTKIDALKPLFTDGNTSIQRDWAPANQENTSL